MALALFAVALLWAQRAEANSAVGLADAWIALVAIIVVAAAVFAVVLFVVYLLLRRASRSESFARNILIAAAVFAGLLSLSSSLLFAGAAGLSGAIVLGGDVVSLVIAGALLRAAQRAQVRFNLTAARLLRALAIGVILLPAVVIAIKA